MGLKDTLKEMKEKALEEEAEAERKKQEDAGEPLQWVETVEWEDDGEIDPDDLEGDEEGEVCDDDAMDPEDLDDGEYD